MPRCNRLFFIAALSVAALQYTFFAALSIAAASIAALCNWRWSAAIRALLYGPGLSKLWPIYPRSASSTSSQSWTFENGQNYFMSNLTKVSFKRSAIRLDATNDIAILRTKIWKIQFENIISIRWVMLVLNEEGGGTQCPSWEGRREVCHSRLCKIPPPLCYYVIVCQKPSTRFSLFSTM